MRIVTFFKILSILILLCGTCLLDASGEDTGKAPVANEKKCKARLTIDGLGVICGNIVPVPLDGHPDKPTVNIRAYAGIPYAKPPVEELRWRKPQPHEGWSGELDATQPCPQCPQPTKDNPNHNPMHEDCLYLNV